MLEESALEQWADKFTTPNTRVSGALWLLEQIEAFVVAETNRLMADRGLRLAGLALAEPRVLGEYKGMHRVLAQLHKLCGRKV